jgi:hypothetical protein
VCGFNCIWTVIRVIMFFSGVELFEAPSYNFQLNLRVFTMVAGPIINVRAFWDCYFCSWYQRIAFVRFDPTQFLAAFVGYKLYRELKLELNPMYGVGDDGEDPYGGNGVYGGNANAPMGGYPVNQAPGGSAPAAAPAGPSGGGGVRATPTPSGFRAFQG